MALEPIHRKYNVEILNVASYQAVSGTGKDAVAELNLQLHDKNAEPKVYPKKIAFNAIPQCDIFLDNDFTVIFGFTSPEVIRPVKTRPR